MRGLPKLIVFDLDYTLWPFWVDTHVTPPFKKNSDGKVYDKHGKHVSWYKDVPEVLEKLKTEDYVLAVASRTSYPEGAEKLLKLFDWNKFFTYKEMFPDCKLTHFKRLRDQSGIAYEDMMFFDDEHRNIVDVSGLGVNCVFVKGGLSAKLMEESLQKCEGGGRSGAV